MKNLYKYLFTLTASLIISGFVNAQTELVTDGSFEAGPGGGAWTEASTNFGTPLCDLAGCGTGTGTGPHTGNIWSWFGGYDAGTETGSVTQSFIIPVGGTVTLTFWLEQIACDDSVDFMQVTVDGNIVFTSNGASPLCGVLGYSQQTVDISTYADGNSHTLEFFSTTFATNGTVTNFFVDDISVISTIGGTGGSACADTTTFAGLTTAIPDDDPLGVTDSQVISGVPGTLGIDLQLKSVCFKIDHTWVGDLIVTLISPNGTQIPLADRPGFPTAANGCDGDNIYVCIDIGTGNELENICTTNTPSISGSYTAANNNDLSAVNTAGGPANGTWQLFASDNVAQDTGIITEWSLVFDDGPVASWASPGAICATAGNIALDSLVTGTTGGTWSGSGVTGSTFDPTGQQGPIAITYTVTDTVAGCTDAQTHNILVVAGPPVAGFTSNVVSLTANFTSTSTGAGTYSWDFGDTGTSTLQNPAHTYAGAGAYTVILTVSNACGSDSSTQIVTVAGCPDIIIDGSFEAGIGSGSWVETSTNFGTPLCDAGCGLGGGTGPLTGTIWSWFGGIATFEEATLSQDITIAANSTATLAFWLEMPNCDGPDDFLKVAVDADTVYTIDGANAICGVIGYVLQTVNMDAYDDGLPHTLTFISRSYGTNGGVTNFMVDDISLVVCPGIGFAENNLSKYVNVMPIPARDYINVTFRDIVASDVKLEIYDMIGKTVMNSTIANVNDDHLERIDVSSWSKGVYMIKVTAGNNSIIRKVVIE